MSNHEDRDNNNKHLDIENIDQQDKEEIDLELVKSIEKLVEEETNVAKASLESQSANSTTNMQKTHENNVAQMKTQILPNIKEVEKEVRGIERAVVKKEISNVSRQSDTIKDDNKKKKQLQIIIAAIVAAVVIIAIVAAVIAVNNKKKTYKYNYDKAIELYQKQDYKSAVLYFEKAYKTNIGMKDTEMMILMYECYLKNNYEDSAFDILKNILSLDKNNETALKALAQYYYNKQDGESLNKLITDYRGTNGEKYLTQYEVEPPQASEKPGEYSEELQITLLAADDCTIYYTTDGTQPEKNGTQYKESIELVSGTNIIKAVSVDKMGVVSKEAEFEYKINFKKPGAPDITPVSGVYTAGEKIVMEAKEGCTIYYTLDGTTPSTSSQVYDEPFDMPEGNTVVSAICVDKHELVSSVARRNYIINASKSYTYTEALEFLKNRMKELNVIQADGVHTQSGEEIVFTCFSKVTIDQNEMYCIQCDIKKNGCLSTEGFYGVDVKSGECYIITGTEGAYKAVAY